MMGELCRPTQSASDSFASDEVVVVVSFEHWCLGKEAKLTGLASGAVTGLERGQVWQVLLWSKLACTVSVRTSVALSR